VRAAAMFVWRRSTLFSSMRRSRHHHSGLIEQVLAIPSMRYERNPIEFLTHVEIEALLAATDQDTWIGRRDRTLLL